MIKVIKLNLNCRYKHPDSSFDQPHGQQFVIFIKTVTKKMGNSSLIVCVNLYLSVGLDSSLLWEVFLSTVG